MGIVILIPIAVFIALAISVPIVIRREVTMRRNEIREGNARAAALLAQVSR